MNHRLQITILIATACIAIIGVFNIAPIAQDLNYHNFADTRSLASITNFGDVTGNVFFIIFGIMGIRFVQSTPHDSTCFSMKGERLLWQGFFFGAALVGLGSGYYHLAPDNASLVWDRLPMTIAFMAFFSVVIMERINPKLGKALFPILLLAGISSVYYWGYTESLGRGDLRPYALVQFLPLLLTALMLWLFPARYDGMKYLAHTLGWYALAKILEHFDHEIFTLLQGTVSGHTLKHIAAAMGVYAMLRYLQHRKLLKNSNVNSIS